MLRSEVAAAAVVLLGLSACSDTGRQGSAGSSGYSGASTPSGYSGSSYTPSSASGSSYAGSAQAGLPSTGASEAQLRQNLMRHGYSNISDIRQSSDGWVGTAVNARGQPVDFDADTGGVIIIHLQ